MRICALEPFPTVTLERVCMADVLMKLGAPNAQIIRIGSEMFGTPARMDQGVNVSYDSIHGDGPEQWCHGASLPNTSANRGWVPFKRVTMMISGALMPSGPSNQQGGEMVGYSRHGKMRKQPLSGYGVESSIKIHEDLYSPMHICAKAGCFSPNCWPAVLNVAANLGAVGTDSSECFHDTSTSLVCKLRRDYKLWSAKLGAFVCEKAGHCLSHWLLETQWSEIAQRCWCTIGFRNHLKPAVFPQLWNVRNTGAPPLLQ